jgi:hypothetical protein
MSRIAILLVLAISLTGCGVVDTMVDGAKHVTAVENDLQTSTGMRPRVGFRWSNGQLESVTVMFPRLYDGKPLGELATMVRRSVIRQFKQTPKDLVLAFSLGSVAADQTQQQSD